MGARVGELMVGKYFVVEPAEPALQRWRKQYRERFLSMIRAPDKGKQSKSGKLHSQCCADGLYRDYRLHDDLRGREPGNFHLAAYIGRSDTPSTPDPPGDARRQAIPDQLRK